MGGGTEWLPDRRWGSGAARQMRKAAGLRWMKRRGEERRASQGGGRTGNTMVVFWWSRRVRLGIYMVSVGKTVILASHCGSAVSGLELRLIATRRTTSATTTALAASHPAFQPQQLASASCRPRHPSHHLRGTKPWLQWHVSQAQSRRPALQRNCASTSANQST